MSEIKTLSQHRWHDIMLSFGVDEKMLNKRHQPCPFCGGKDRFRYTDLGGDGWSICNQCAPKGMDGFEFLMQYANMNFSSVAKSIESILGETTARPQQNTDLSKARGTLNKIWKESLPLAKGDPVHRYLLSRGLEGVLFSQLHNIKHHPALDYWDVEENKPIKRGTFPAMVARAMTPDAKPVTVQCLYLTPSGNKADVPTPKKTKTPAFKCESYAVRLKDPEPGQVLCVAEGIETALSLHKLYPETCPWACLSAGMMDKFCPPECTTIMIGGDNDASFTGQAAAFTLAKRLAGKKQSVQVLIPEQVGVDWNDVVRKRLRSVA